MLPASGSFLLRVGLLFPQSEIFPRLKADLLISLQMALQRHQGVEILTEFIYAGDAKSVERALNKCYYEYDCKVLIAVVNSKVIVSLAPLVAKLQLPILVINLGENLPQPNWQQPFLYFISLHTWRSELVLAQWAQKKFGGTCAFNTSVYDSGYGLVEAYKLGLTAGGASQMHLNILRNPIGEFATHTLFENMSKQPFSFMHVLLSGKESANFFERHRFFNERKPITMSQFMLEMLNEMPAGITQKFYSASTYQHGSLSAVNVDFRKKFCELAGRKPGSFALLGYEAGLLLAARLALCPPHKMLPTAWFLIPDDLQLEGPRGAMHLYMDTSKSDYPVYIYEHTCSLDHESIVSQLIAEVKEEIFDLTELHKHSSLALSGWQNPYLCL